MTKPTQFVIDAAKAWLRQFNGCGCDALRYIEHLEANQRPEPLSPEEQAKVDEAILTEVLGHASWESDHETPIRLALAFRRQYERGEWRPTPPVNPDLLAAREWLKKRNPGSFVTIGEGLYDTEKDIQGFLAGLKHARGE